MYDVCIIGAGRVGLPLALTMQKYHNITIIERDETIINAVENGIMPFHEPGFCDLIAEKKIKTQKSDAEKANLEFEHIIICIGTPLLPNMEPDVVPLYSLIRSICGSIKVGNHICLRSTVAPGICKKILEILQQQLPSWELGKDYFFSYCPERISEGLAKQELIELPQIIGSNDINSRLKAEKLFIHANKLLPCDIEEAELCKVFCNAQRYAEFAIGNQLAMLAMKNGKNPHKIFELAQDDYPRFRHIKPGYTAGTCLRKDYGFLSWNTSDVDIFTSAWKINEHLPVFVINQLKDLQLIKAGTNVLLAGITFKKNCDDIRDSLGSKLYRQLKYHLCNVDVYEPMIKHDYIQDSETKSVYRNSSTKEIENKQYDIIVVGSPHDLVLDYISKINYECWISDIWGVTSKTCKSPLYKNIL